MPTRYTPSAQTGEGGIALVRQITTEAGAIFRPFEVADLGIDAAIEFLTEQREPSGDIVLTQVKAGKSYIRQGRFYLDTDKDHFETWSRYAVPVIGIVCDLSRKEARWVDISAHLQQHPEAIEYGPYSLEAPATQAFSPAEFASFVRRFRRDVTASTRVDVTPNLLIRPWQPSDTKPTRALLSVIAPDYPGFDAWLNRKLADSKPSKKVVAVGDVIAAFSMWQRKDERNVKLQTFIVGASYRGTAIGQHLLYHELRTWAADALIERVHVTVASSKAELITYFRIFGFRVEGFSPNRYPRPAAELVMAKHFLREVIRTPTELDNLVSRLSHHYWGLAGPPTSRFGVNEVDLAIPTSLSALTTAVNQTEGTAIPRLLLKDTTGQEILRHDDESLMREFYPLRIHLRRKRYVIIPIRRQWVRAMLSTSGPGTPLKLRTDHVYYCYPKVTDLTKGDLVIFYETIVGGGSGSAIGSAVVQEVAIEPPARLFLKYAQLGIYQLHNIEEHENSLGQAMAIKFSLFESFRPVGLIRIRQHLANKTTLQGLTPISRDGFEAIRAEGLTLNQ
jgi:ribosomal protein S18 acetylase RimI-like enzyme